MRKAVLFLFYLITSLLIFLLFTSFLLHDFDFILFLFVAFLILIFFIICIIVSIKSGSWWYLFRFGIILVECFLIFFTPLKIVGVYTRFEYDKKYYVSVIDSLRRGETPICDQVHCIVEDKSLPMLVFQWDGLLDNWNGICYDPTGLVMKANDLKDDWSNRNDPELTRATSLFGGTLYRVRPLYDHWYFCVFT